MNALNTSFTLPLGRVASNGNGDGSKSLTAPPNRRRTGPAHRSGVTILEVLFATGIAISGMLGVASLLLMAGRNASQANRATQAQALAQDWYNEFHTRGMSNPSTWVWYQDYAFPAGATTISPQFRTFAKNSFPSNAFARASNSVGSTGLSTLRPSGKVSVCIDPAFYSDRTVRSTISAFNQANAGVHWYRPALFPYYQDGFNPVTDSDYSISTSSGIAWNDQPRMLRVTLGAPGNTMSEAQVQSMFATQDDLNMFASDDDATLPAVRNFQQMPLANGTRVIAKGAGTTPYSWMATLSPLDELNNTTENYYTLSLVVLHQRDRLFVDPSTFMSRTAAQPNPASKPQGERLTWVVPLSGNFTGGNGGRVRLIASEGTDSKVNTGDWIMLSKHVAASGPAGGPIEPFSVFRWYRIVGIDEAARTGDIGVMGPDPTATNFTDPYGNNPGGPPSDGVWARDVVLEGPDWQFNSVVTVQGAGVPLLTPTSGTLVNGAVAVYERVVEIPDSPSF